MSLVKIPASRVDPLTIGRPPIWMPSGGVDAFSQQIRDRLLKLAAPSPTFSGGRARSSSLEEQLYDTLASFKIRTSTVAMYLSQQRRNQLFRQLDSLLSAEDWDRADTPPKLGSFATFLRMILALKPERQPGIGATADGHLITAWTVKHDRLTIECLPNDTSRWYLSAVVSGDRERAAGITPISRLAEVLKPYSPDRWFSYAGPS